MSKPVVALAEAYGHRGSEPGLSNEAIARLIQERHHQIDHLFARWEIQKALKPYGISPERTVLPLPNPGEYMDTVQSINQMLSWCSAADLSQAEVWVFCHRTHKTYINLLLKLRGVKVDQWITTPVYDKASHQPWTRGPVVSFLMKIRRGFAYLLQGRFFTRPQ